MVMKIFNGLRWQSTIFNFRQLYSHMTQQVWSHVQVTVKLTDMSYQAFGCVVYLFFGNTEIGMHRRVQPMGSAVATTTKGHASGHRNRSMTRSLSADVALWMGLHTTTSQYNSISFTLHGCGIQHQITAGWTSVGAVYLSTIHYCCCEFIYHIQSIGFWHCTTKHRLWSKDTINLWLCFCDYHLAIPSNFLSLRTSYIQLHLHVCHPQCMWTISFPWLVTAQWYEDSYYSACLLDGIKNLLLNQLQAANQFGSVMTSDN